jgi:hypothetical protein
MKRCGASVTKGRGGAVSALAEARVGRFIERSGLAASEPIEGDWFVKAWLRHWRISAERFKDL